MKLKPSLQTIFLMLAAIFSLMGLVGGIGTVFSVGLAPALPTVILIMLAGYLLIAIPGSDNRPANIARFQVAILLIAVTMVIRIGFWPWILVLLGASAIMVALDRSGVVAMFDWLKDWLAQVRRWGQRGQTPLPSYSPVNNPSSSPTYQQGYQPAQKMYNEESTPLVYPGFTRYRDVEEQSQQEEQQIPRQF